MSWIQDLKNKIDLVDFIREDGIELKKEGSGYSCKCPFHLEKTASFKIKEEEQFFKCFGCGAKGDIIEYFKLRNSLDNWYMAAKELALKYNIEIDDKEFNSADYKKIENLHRVNKLLELYYKTKFNELPEEHPAKQEILKRGLKITEDNFGYAPNDRKDILNCLKTNHVTKEDILELGIINENFNLILSDRLIFFIKDYMGNTIGFSGRSLDNSKKYKYVNSKASLIFDKQNALYNIEIAKTIAHKEKEIYLVEGQFDVEAMKQNGYENVVATSGTAFTLKHAKLIRRTISENGKLYLMLDGDIAGQKAMYSIFKNFPEIQENLYIIQLPNNEDPCEYLQKNKILPKPEFYMSYLFNLIKNKFDLNILENRLAFMNQIKTDLLEHISMKSYKEQYLKSAASLSGISSENIKFKEKEKKNIIKENESILNKISKIDLFYLTSIAYMITNKSIHNINKINSSIYPDKYKDFIIAINSNLDKKFIKENYEDKFSKLIETINEIETHQIKDLAQYQSHLKFLINNAKEEESRVIEQEKLFKLTNQMKDLSSEQIIKFLEKGLV